MQMVLLRIDFYVKMIYQFELRNRCAILIPLHNHGTLNTFYLLSLMEDSVLDFLNSSHVEKIFVAKDFL